MSEKAFARPTVSGRIREFGGERHYRIMERGVPWMIAFVIAGAIAFPGVCVEALDAIGWPTHTVRITGCFAVGPPPAPTVVDVLERLGGVATTDTRRR